MKRSRELTLKKETLVALTDDVLSGVAGASATFGVTCYTCTCRSCVDCIAIGPTLPDNDCMPNITFRTVCEIPPG